MRNNLVNVIVLSVIISLLTFFYKEEIFPDVQTTRAFGDLKADFGVVQIEPLFRSLGIAAGESETRYFTYINDSASGKKVYLKGIKITPVDTNESLLDIEIDSETETIYGQGSKTGKKTLKDFFADSQKGRGIPAGVIEAGKRHALFITVSLPEKAGAGVTEIVTFDIDLETSSRF